MSVFSTGNPRVIAFGLLGNLISFVVFLAPIPTFIRVYRKKSTEGFHPFPYLISLFSAGVWIHYAALQSQILLVTVNSMGCLLEFTYIALYIAFAPKKSRIVTSTLLILVNFGALGLTLLLSHFLAKGPTRIKILGWLAVALGVSVFAAPLSIMRVVVRTKSVEYMPFLLSFFLTLSAATWLLYGVFLKDIYVTLPNILGLVFGTAQMILYAIYRKKKPVMVDEQKLHPVQKTDVEMADPNTIDDMQKNVDSNPIADEEDEPDDPSHTHFHPPNCTSMDMMINQGQPVVACPV